MQLTGAEVEAVLRRKLHDPWFCKLLRRFLVRELSGRSLAQLTDDALASTAAEHLLSYLNRSHRETGLVSLALEEILEACPELRQRHRPLIGTWPTVPYSPEPEPEQVQAKEPDWVTFRVVKDKDGAPVGGVTLKLELPGGISGRETTNATGKIERDLDEGGPSTVSADLSRTTVGSTLRVVGIGEATIEPDEKDKLVKQAEAIEGFWPRGDLRVAQIETHQVTAQDTRESLAGKAGMSWLDLAEFNFGTRDPDKIERCLEVFVGCTKKSADGREFVFDDGDKPGQIFLPAPWSKDNLEEKRVHTIRVRPVIPKLHIWYQIDLDNPDTHNDSVILRAADESFELKLALAGLKEVLPNYVELIFPRPPDGVRYHLLQDPGDGKTLIFIFKNITNEDLIIEPPLPLPIGTMSSTGEDAQ